MVWGVFFEFLRLYCSSFGMMCAGCVWGMQASCSVYGAVCGCIACAHDVCAMWAHV